MNAELLRVLCETTLATSAAALLVLALRRPLMARLGASIVYALWALVPVAGLAMLLPAPESAPTPMMLVARIGALSPVATRAAQAETFAWTTFAVVLWVSGALATAALFAWQQWRFQRRLAGSAPHGEGLRIAHGSEGLPAVVGLLRPRIVLPADFDLRYDAGERELILCHERIHVARRDLWANAVAAVLRALFWFNPLLHYAAWRFRRDQELACDERVVAHHPQRRRDYAGAMLKTQMADSSLPVGCHWQASTPLKERIAMLKEHAPKPMRSAVGAALVLSLLAGGGYVAWAAQPVAPHSATDAAAKKERYAVDLNVEVDGKPAGSFKVIAISGQPFGFTVNGDAATSPSFEGTFVTSKFGVDAVKLEGSLAKLGEKPSDVGIAVKLGQSGSIAVGNKAAPDFRLDARISMPTATELETIRRSEKERNRPLDCLLTADKKVPNGGRYYCGQPGPDYMDAKIPFAGERLPAPVYPAAAAQQGISGKVLLVVDVAADGSVRGVEIEKSEPAGVFDAATLEAVKQWRFAPAIENGKPAAGRVRVPVDFKVEKEDGAGGVVPRSAG